MSNNLMRYFFFLIMLTSCSCVSKFHLRTPFKQTSGDLFKTINFDGCDYVQVEYGIEEYSSYQLIHKENCRNHKN